MQTKGNLVSYNTVLPIMVHVLWHLHLKNEVRFSIEKRLKMLTNYASNVLISICEGKLSLGKLGKGLGKFTTL
jgi:hypothetical protein